MCVRMGDLKIVNENRVEDVVAAAKMNQTDEIPKKKEGETR